MPFNHQTVLRSHLDGPVSTVEIIVVVQCVCFWSRGYVRGEGIAPTTHTLLLGSGLGGGGKFKEIELLHKRYSGAFHVWSTTCP
jgi:hypothetical protein